MIDLEGVGAILREAAIVHIAPRFNRLAANEIDEKSPGEIVTIADREAESFISTRLQSMTPGIPIVGEEAVAQNPRLIHALDSPEPVWLVDPLDGTANFARGSSHWAVMAALVEHGITIAAAIYRHSDNLLYLAMLNNGAWRNGQRLVVAGNGASVIGELRGSILTRFLTESELPSMLARQQAFREVTAGYACAGYEYPAIAEGQQNFALFQRVLPWDHAPGALILSEAGGVVRHPDGSTYSPAKPNRGLLLAPSPEIWQTVRDTLYPSHP